MLTQHCEMESWQFSCLMKGTTGCGWAVYHKNKLVAIAFTFTLQMCNPKLTWQHNTKQRGLARIWTAIAGFRVQSANRYTTRPCYDSTFLAVISTSICIWVRRSGLLTCRSGACQIEQAAAIWCCCWISPHTSLGEMLGLCWLGSASKVIRSRQRRHLQYNASKQIQKWTHWGLNPGPPACWAGVIPLHHVPNERLPFDQCFKKSKCIQHSKMFFSSNECEWVTKQCEWVMAETKKWSHAGLNRGPYGYWPYALANWAMRPWEIVSFAELKRQKPIVQCLAMYTTKHRASSLLS